MINWSHCDPQLIDKSRKMRLTWKEANTERTPSTGPNQLTTNASKSPPGVIATQMEVFSGWSTALNRQHSMNEDEEADFASFGSSETCRLNGQYDDGDHAWYTLYKGILFSSLSSVFFSLSSVIVKVLDRWVNNEAFWWWIDTLHLSNHNHPLVTRRIHPAELAIFRFIGIFVLTLPMVVYSGENPFGPRELRHYLIIRGLAGATSLFLRFCAFRYLPIADASVIIFSVPVFVSIFARLFLNVRTDIGISHYRQANFICSNHIPSTGTMWSLSSRFCRIDYDRSRNDDKATSDLGRWTYGRRIGGLRSPISRKQFSFRL